MLLLRLILFTLICFAVSVVKEYKVFLLLYVFSGVGVVW